MKFFTVIFAFVFATICFAADVKFDLNVYTAKATPKEKSDYLKSCNVFEKSDVRFKLVRGTMLAGEYFREKDVAFTYKEYLDKIKEQAPEYEETINTKWDYINTYASMKTATIDTIIKFCQDNFTGTDLEKRGYNLIAARYMSNRFGLAKNIDKAIENYKKAEEFGYGGLFNAYYQKRDRENTWKTGVALLTDDYVTPKVAMNTIKNMFNRKPASLKNEDIVAFLKELAEKYPTPGSNFDDWKGFMGFIGYKYKSITGQDLFKNDAATTK